MTNPHTDDRHPFWKVAAIFGEDEDAEDFAYTIGLHERGVPELWVASRPALGDDPGADWKFSLQDMGMLLNRLSWDWMAGDLKVGDTFEETYDAGLVTIRFRVDPPDDRERLEAFQIAPDATIVPVRWSLHRAAPGPNDPMTPDVEAAASTRFDELVLGLGSLPPAPTGWEVPGVADWAPDGRYGPRTPLALAHAAYLWSADPVQLLEIFGAALDVSNAKTLKRRWATFWAFARVAGREHALDLLGKDVSAFVEDFVPGVAPAVLDELGDPEDPDDVHFLTEILRQLLMNVMGAEIVGDLLPEESRLECLGLVIAARRGMGNTAGPDWLASEEVVEAFEAFLSAVGPARTYAICELHDHAESSEYWRIVARLRAENLTTASCWWPLEQSLGAEFFADFGRARDAAGESGGTSLHEWGSLVTALLTHRMRFDQDQVDAFVAPFAGAVPELRQLLNTPL